ncbi:MAG: PIG-L family deacetylase [Planctomycetales bacterium]|nr:PIG-L family deacetylase [Planctomycetales bacterium]
MTAKKDKERIEFVRLVGDEKRIGDTLAGVSRHWQGDKERFLFISPHDDDVVLGAGLFIQLAQRENVPVYILIVTDGSMGYCTPEQKNTISEVRREETYACYTSLGVPRENIIWLGFPDCWLSYYRGRRHSEPNDRTKIEGYVGLQNSFTHWIRKTAPSQCFLPTSNDLHPDHKIVHEEFLISLFHAAGNIWPELGNPAEKVPFVHEMAVYCDFPQPPKVRIQTPSSYLEKKLEAIAAYKSQKQIGSLIEIVRKSGPYEYLRELNFKLYQPALYYDMFEKKHHMPFIR